LSSGISPFSAKPFLPVIITVRLGNILLILNQRQSQLMCRTDISHSRNNELPIQCICQGLFVDVVLVLAALFINQNEPAQT
jgi:hypothetical protein